MAKPNRVWIEIEMPAGAGGAIAEARAAAFTAMLRKLGGDGDVEWNSKRCCYEYCSSPAAGSYFLDPEEPGFWFNLDYFAMSPAEQEAA